LHALHVGGTGLLGIHTNGGHHEKAKRRQEHKFLHGANG
jgi:hypothetical protein